MRTLVSLVVFGVALSPAHTKNHGMQMEATAYAAPPAKPTSAVTVPHEGIVAADPNVLPLGTRIRVSGAGKYDGIYTVTDTGSKVIGRHIDIYLPSEAQAKRFGKKQVWVRVLEGGTGKNDARKEDLPAASAKK